MLVATATARYACPTCWAQPGEICRNLNGTALSKLTGTHIKRLHKASADKEVIAMTIDNMASGAQIGYGHY